MSQILRLEYVCTDAEKRQAQTMALRTRLGGGSKWRTRLVLLLMLVGMLLGFYFGHQEIPRVFRLLAIAGVVGFSTAFVYWKNRSRGNPQVATTTVEASENEFAILGPDSKVRLPWSAFSRCLESPDLFVLLDRSEATLIVVPKRAFPSEDWQSWFRTQAKTPPNPANSALLEPATVSPPTPSNGIALKFQLGFRDYLDRSIASLRTWRVVSIVVVFFLGRVHNGCGPSASKPGPFLDRGIHFHAAVLPCLCRNGDIRHGVSCVAFACALQRCPGSLGY